MPNPVAMTKDPRFLALGLEDRARLLSEMDPKFAGLEPSQQIDFVAGFGVPDMKPQEPGILSQARAGFDEGGARLTGALARGIRALPGESTILAPGLERMSRTLSEGAERVRHPSGLGGKIVRGGFSAPADIAGITAATALAGGNPVAGMIGYGQATLPEETTAKERVHAAGVDATLGALFPFSQTWGRGARAATLGAAGAGATALEGGSAEDVAASGLTMGGLAAVAPTARRSGVASERPNLAPEHRAVVATATEQGPSRADIPGQRWLRAVESERAQLNPVPEAEARAFAQATGGTEPLPPKAANINLAKIDSPEGVKRALVETAKLYEPRITEARRDVVSHAETAKLARDLGLSESDLLSRRKGQAFNAHEAVAARALMIESADEAMQAAARVRETGSPEAMAELQTSLARHAAIQEQVAGITAEAGRALNSYRIALKQAQQSKAISAIVTKSGGEVRLRDIADRMALLEDPAQVAAFTREAAVSTRLDKIQEAWINALLSGPKTHVANTTSNALYNALNLVEEAGAAAIGAVTRSPDRVRFGEIPARLFATRYGISQGLELARKSWREGTGGLAEGKIELPKREAIGGRAGKVARLPGRALVAEDEFFKAIAIQQELAARAYRMAVSEGKTGKARAERITEILQAPPEAMLQEARLRGRELTFTQDLGPTGRAIGQVIASKKLLRFIVPFHRTPTNIMKAGLARNPVFAGALKEVRDDFRAGGARRDRALSRIAVGSGLSAMVVQATLDGRITGSGPKDPAERAALYATGWQPYSIRVGDRWVSYNRFEPISTVIGLAADFAEIAPTLSEEDRNALAARIALSFSTNISSKTFTRGPAELLLAISDPARYGESWAESLVGSVVPTVVADVARTVDPTIRDPQNPLEAIQARIPGLSQGVAPRIDQVTGEPIVREGTLGPDLLSPVYQSRVKDDPVASEMARLGFGPGKPGKELRGEKMSEAEHRYLAETSARMAHEILTPIVGAKEWARIPDENKEKLIRDVYAKTRGVARTQILASRVKQRGQSMAEGYVE